MYNAPMSGLVATGGTLAFTGAALSVGWLIVAAITLVFVGLAIMKIMPKRKASK